MYNKMKKAVAFGLILIMILVLGACGAKTASVTTEEQNEIVILGPMDCEMTGLIQAMDVTAEYTKGNFSVYEGTYHDNPLVVIRCLIGMVNAAAATQFAIDTYAPEMVIIQGTAGGHNPDYHQGTIVLGKNIVETGSYYSPHKDAGEGSDYTLWERPGAEMLEEGEIVRELLMHSDERLLEIALGVENRIGDVVLGTVGSADQWNKELDYIANFHEQLGTDCEEMEGFAVAQVCASHDIPFLCIRIISNSELYPEELFSEAFGNYCQEYTLDVVDAYWAAQKK